MSSDIEWEQTMRSGSNLHSVYIFQLIDTLLSPATMKEEDDTGSVSSASSTTSGSGPGCGRRRGRKRRRLRPDAFATGGRVWGELAEVDHLGGEGDATVSCRRRVH